jgi:hypothetical protein
LNLKVTEKKDSFNEKIILVGNKFKKKVMENNLSWQEFEKTEMRVEPFSRHRFFLKQENPLN